jgi:hypothetical protein
VIFNEDEPFDGNLDRLKDDLPHDSPDELSDLLTSLEQSNILVIQLIPRMRNIYNSYW